MRAESITSDTFNFKTTLYQQKNPEVYFKRAVIHSSILEADRNAEASYRIWYWEEWENSMEFSRSIGKK